MKKHDNNNDETIKTLVLEYEVLSQQGAVGFYEETVFMKIAEHYEKRFMLNEALDVISLAIEQNSYSSRLYFKKARLLLEKGFQHSAMECIDKAESLAPFSDEIKCFKIKVLIDQGVLKEASQIIESIEHKGDKELASPLYYYKALILEQRNEYRKMFVMLRKALYANHKNEAALKKIWISVELSRSYIESRELHQYLIDKDPYNYVAWHNLGHAYFCLEDYRNAEEAFEFAFLSNQSFEFAYRDCAEARIKLKEFDRALECYEDVLSLFKADSDLYINIGYCYESMEDLELAMVCYEKSFRFDLNNPRAYFRKGECYMKEGIWDEAIKSYKHACALDGNKGEYLVALAEAYYQNDNDELADDAFYRATESTPESRQYWLQYANFLIDKNRGAEALDLIYLAEVNTGKGSDLLYCKAVCLFQTNDRKEALYILKTALQQDYALHVKLFDLNPGLKKDQDVIIAINGLNSN